MAVNNFNGGYLPSLGIKYTATTDDFTDWASVPNDTYFYDFQSELPYYKNGAGDIIGIFEPTGTGTLSSVGLTMPSAFNVSNSPLITDGTIAVTGAGLTSQYVRGDGTLADFPTNAGGGGSSQVFYLNGGTSQGTFSGGTYYQLSETPVDTPNVDFSTAVDGVIAQFITDVNQPDEIEIPAGNWIFGTYFSASSSGGSPQFYIEVLKWNGTTFTSISDSSANPEIITGGTAVDLYFTAVAMPQTSLLATDRIAVRYVVTCDGRTITIHTQQQQLSQVTTTFTKGITALNGLTDNTQYFATGTTGTDFGVLSTGDTHTFNLPVASAVNTGKLSSTDWTTFNNKPSVNIYTGDGTLSGSRQVTMGAFNMSFLGQGTTTGFFKTRIENIVAGTYTQITNDVSQASITAVGGTNSSTITFAQNLIESIVASSSSSSTIDQSDGQITNVVDDGVTNRSTNLTPSGFNINGEYTFPNLDGSAGEVLTTNGLGSLSWATPTSTNIYNSDGTLTGDRTLTFSGNRLFFTGTSITGAVLSFEIKAQNIAGGRLIQLKSVFNTATTSVGVTTGSVSLGYVNTATSVNSDLLLESTSATLTYDDATTQNNIAITSGDIRLSCISGVNSSVVFLNPTNGFNINNAYYLPKVDGSANQVLTTNGSGNVSWQNSAGITLTTTGTNGTNATLVSNTLNIPKTPYIIQTACSDETTALTTGTNKVVFRMPQAMTLTSVRASLTTAQTSGSIFTCDILQNGVSILSTLITIDNTEKTSTTAVTLPVISTSALTDDSEISVSITQVGDGTAKGLKVSLIGVYA